MKGALQMRELERPVARVFRRLRYQRFLTALFWSWAMALAIVAAVIAGEKLLNHPRKGLLRFEYASFQANDDPALKLVIYTPV